MGIFTCLTLLLGACAGDKGRYPSLAIRDIERVTGEFGPREIDPASPEPQPIASPQEIDALVATAQNAFSKFETAQPIAAQSVRASNGQPTDSLAYTRALLALADLSTLRSDTILALGELDLLAAQAATQFAPAQDVIAAQSMVASLVEQQDMTLSQLWTAMDQ